MLRSKISADLEIKSTDTNPGAMPAYSVKLDGHEISQFVKGLTLDIDACGVSELRLKVNTEKISVNSRCVWDIPEPYAGLLEGKKTASPDFKACGQDGQSGTGRNLG